MLCFWYRLASLDIYLLEEVTAMAMVFSQWFIVRSPI